jgi:hypothetical protein
MDLDRLAWLLLMLGRQQTAEGDVPMQLERTRAHLLSQLDAINSAESAMAFQRALARELSAAETAASPDSRWHRHLLRLMGGALARQLLSPHTLRELARDQRPVSALTDQGDDFEFVLDVAERLAHDGVAPIVADLTHLIGVGDLIAVTPDDISIIECKNRQMPDGWMLRGRQWRQRQRQAEAASYLANGYVRGVDGQSRIALEIDEPKPRREELRACVQRARGTARPDRRLPSSASETT